MFESLILSLLLGASASVSNSALASSLAHGPVVSKVAKTTTAPTVSLSINGGAAYTNSTTVTLTLSPSDTPKQMYITNTAGCATGGTWKAYASTTTWTLGKTNSLTSVYVEVKDANKTSACASASITEDSAAPVAKSILIDGGSAYTDSTAATLTLAATAGGPAPVSQMYITPTAGCASGGNWVTYATSASYTLTPNSLNTVYARFKDAAGNLSACISASITHSNVTPTLTVTSPKPNSYVNQSNVNAFPISGTCSASGQNVVLSGSFHATALCTAGAWSTSVNLSGLSDGSISFVANLTDNYGNSAVPVSVALTKETVAPLAQSILINGGAVSTTSLAVTLTLAASASATQMYITQTAACASNGTWAPYATTAPWTLLNSNANNTVYVQFRDAAQNQSACISATIAHDPAPALAVTAPVSGSYVNLSNESQLTFSGTCSPNGQNVVLSGSASQQVPCAAGAWTTALNFSALPDGALSVNVNITNSHGVPATPVSIALTKDTVPPTGTISIAGTIANDGVLYTDSPSVTLLLNSPTATAVYVTTDPLCQIGGIWTPYAASLPWTLSSMNQTDWVYAAFSDVAGNVSSCVSASILEDSTPASFTVINPVNNSYVNAYNQSTFALNGTCSTNDQPVLITGVVSGSALCTNGAWSTTLSLYGQPDQAYNFTFNFNDDRGHSATPIVRTVTRDSQIPSVAFTSPAPGTYINLSNYKSTTITGTCSVNNFPISLTGAVTATATCNSGIWSTPVDFSNSPQGSVAVWATLVDIAGNTDKEPLWLNVDTMPPSLTITAPASGAIVTSLNITDFEFSGTCSALGQLVTLSSSASTLATTTCTPSGTWTIQANLTSLPSGPTTLNFSANDLAGNPTSASLSINIQSKMAGLTFTSPTPGQWIDLSNVANFTISGTCAATGQNVQLSGPVITATVPCVGGQWSTPLPSTNLPQGSVSISGQTSDGYGDSTNGTVWFNIDTVASTLAVTGPALGATITELNVYNFPLSGTCSPSGHSVQVTGSATGTGNCTNGAWVVPMDLHTLPDGPINFNVSYTDQGGNVATTTANYTKAGSQPGLTFTSPTPGQWIDLANMSTFTVSGTCAANGQNVQLSGPIVTTSAPCVSGQFSTPVTLTNPPQGSVDIYATLSDGFGNSTNNTVWFNVDTVAPTLAVTGPVLGSVITQLNLYNFPLSGTCSPSGHAVQVAGSATGTANCTNGAWVVMMDLHTLADGPINFNVSYTDQGGNVATTTANYTKTGSQPGLTFTSPKSGQWIDLANMSTFTVSGTCGASGQNVQLSGPIVTTSAPCVSGQFSTPVTLTNPPQGSVDIYATLSDGFGNSTNNTVWFNVDTVAPALTVTGPVLGSITELNVYNFPLSGTCSPNGHPVQVTGSATGTANCTNGAWVVMMDLHTLADGPINFNVSYTDQGGNVATTTANYTKKGSQLGLTFTSPTSGQWINLANMSTFTVSGTCGASGQSVQLSGPLVTTAVPCVAGQFSAPVTLTNPPQGSVDIYATLSDGFGNSANNTVWFNVDTSAPAVAVTGPALGSVITELNVYNFPLSGTCSPSGHTVQVTGSASGSGNCTNAAWVVMMDLHTLPDGPINFNVSYTDQGGNQALTTANYTKMGSQLGLTFTSPTSGQWINLANMSTFTVSGTCGASGQSVQLSGLVVNAIVPCINEQFSLQVPLTNPPQGTVDIYATLSDGDGNSTNNMVWFNIDTSAPALAVTGPPLGSVITQLNVYNFPLSGTCSPSGHAVQVAGSATGTANCTNGAWVVMMDLHTLPDGPINFNVTYTDQGGNVASATANYTKAGSQPGLTFTSPKSGQWINLANMSTFSVSGTCGASGQNVQLSGPIVTASVPCLSGQFATSVTLANPPQGSVDVYATLSDGFGNSTNNTVWFNVDTVAPTLAVSAPVSNSVITQLNVYNFPLSGTCSPSGHAVQVTGSATGTANCTNGAWVVMMDLHTLADGPINFNVTYTDQGGNVASATANYTKAGSQAGLTFTSPKPGQWINLANMSTFTVSGTCGASGQNVQLSGPIVTTPVPCVSGQFSTSVALTNPTQGSVDISATLSDGFGNSTNNVVWFNIDTVAPTLAVTGPLLGSVITELNVYNFPLSGTCSPSGHAVQVTGSATGTANCTSGAWVVMMDLHTLADGPINFNLSYTDQGGNVATATANYTKKGSQLGLTLTSPTPGQWVNIAKMSNFTVSGTCGASGQNVQLSGPILTAPVACVAGQFSTTVSLTNPQQGSVDVYATLTDGFGNSTNTVVWFNVDTIAPSLTIQSPSAGAVINASSVSSFTVSGTCSENQRSVVVTGAAAQTSTCSTGNWSASLNFAGNADGTVQISVATTDAAGNSTTVATSFSKQTGSPVQNPATSPTPAPTPSPLPSPASAPTMEGPGPNQALYGAPFYTCLRNFYVSPTGSDANPGTQSQPWLTLQNADLAAGGRVAGDCVNVQPGTYASGISISRGGNAATSGGYVVYRCSQLDGCKVTESDYGFQIVPQNGSSASYVIIDGFELAANTQVVYGSGVQVWDNQLGAENSFSSHHVWVMNSLIHGYGNYGILMNDGEYFYAFNNSVYNNGNATCDRQGSGISLGSLKATAGYTPTAMDNGYAFRNLIEYNVVYDNLLTQCGTASNPVDTSGNGIILDSWDGSGTSAGPYSGSGLVAFNVVAQNGARGIQVYRNSGATVAIANNTVFDNNIDPFTSSVSNGEISLVGSVNTTVVNNIAYALPATSASDARCQGVNFSVSPWNLSVACPLQLNSGFTSSDYSGNGGNDINVTDSGNTWQENITYGGTPPASSGANGNLISGSADAFSCSNNICNVNPGLVNASAFNFALSSVSPATGSGLSESYLPSASLDVGACNHALSSCP